MKEELTKKFILVEMDEVKETSSEKNIIGTEALAACTGLLIYSEKGKKAIVAHLPSSLVNIKLQLISILNENRRCTDFKYLIIPGYYKSNYDVSSEIAKFLEGYPFCIEKSDMKADFRIDKETKSIEFAFDAKSGEFVTEQVYFGKEYYDINKVRV